MTFRVLDWLRGSGDHSVSVPPMDGALKPNDALDLAEVLAEGEAPDNLVELDGQACFSSAGSVLRIGGAGKAEVLASFSSDVTCLAAGWGMLAAGLEEGRVLIRGGRFDGRTIGEVGGRGTLCPVAAAFESENVLLLCLGSQQNPPSGWKRDLLQSNASGSVWRLNLASGQASLVLDRLAFPFGVEATAGGGLLLSESWKHRILEVSESRVRTLVGDLPFYPGRLRRAGKGDLLLCGFAPRRQMVEFILRERAFLARMMAEVPERYWMAPALSSGQDFLEPLQGGQIRQHGVLKPWSPTKSYGLVVRMTGEGQLLRSLHCRAGGARHGITSAIELDSRVLMTSKGGGLVLSAPVREG